MYSTTPTELCTKSKGLEGIKELITTLKIENSLSNDYFLLKN